MDVHTQGVLRLVAAFPRPKVGDSTVALYVSELSSLDPEGFSYVVNQTIQNCHEFPSIAELREQYRAYRLRNPLRHTGPELPAGDARTARVPMPDFIRQQIRDLEGRMDRRAAEMVDD